MAKIFVLQFFRMAYQTLFAEIGEKPVLVVVSSGFADLVEKIDYIENTLGYKVVWMASTVRGMIRTEQVGRRVCDKETILQALQMRRDRSKVIFFTVHAACSPSSVDYLRGRCPGAKFVSYAHDWMNLFVPEEKKEVWQEFGHEPAATDREYAALGRIIRGDCVDAIIHKDYGENFPLLKGTAAKTAWIPPTFPSDLFQPPPDPDTVKENAIYVGTIVSRSTHDRPSLIFEDIFMEDIFDQVTKQGMFVHAYCLKVPDDVAIEYKKRFPDGRVRIFVGALVGKLLKIAATRYKWGWMLYHWPCDMIMDHVKHTLPTKFFTYLTLGIPVIVSEEMEAVARIVRKYECGVIFKQNELDRVVAKLAKVDYRTMQQNVLEAREELCLDRFKYRLADLLKEVMNLPYEESTFGRERNEDRQKQGSESHPSGEGAGDPHPVPKKAHGGR